MTHRPAARHVLPEFSERTSSGVRTLDPYSKLFEERIVFLGTPVDDACANDVMAQFMHLEHADPDRDISLYINSSGGSLTAMTAIHDTMRFVTCDVQTFCLGQVGSVAAVLLAAGAPGKRAGTARLPGTPPAARHGGAGPRTAVRPGDPGRRTAEGAHAHDRAARPVHGAVRPSRWPRTSSGTWSSTPRAPWRTGSPTR